jgi:SAM-dependent methyltransferase
MPKLEPCILCHGSGFRIIQRIGRWRYIRCLKCRLVSLHPRPTGPETSRYYDDYLSFDREEISKWEVMMRLVVEKSAFLIESELKGRAGKLLDIGCGYGSFLGEMKSRGWQVQGIEISRAGRQYAREKWGVQVHSQALEDLALPENFFDVVTLFYVLEHVVDPQALLSRVNHILKPRGLVFLRWPHTTPIVRLLGPLSRRLDLYHTPYHLYDFSPKTMKILLAQSGFQKVKTIIKGHTLPPQIVGRWSSMITGLMGEALCRLSRGKFLFPGVSKTTLAEKDTQGGYGHGSP